MSDLYKSLREDITRMVETVMDGKAAEDFVVIYSGRFQPFHKSHYDVYTSLVKKFGKNKVYIGTSNTVNATNSPFSFSDKKKIMTKLFGIPSNKIVQVKNPYRPQEITNKFDDTKTAYIAVVGNKDAARLSGNGKYFRKYKNSEVLLPMTDAGYVYTIPHMTNVFKLPGGSKDVSGTVVRNALAGGTREEQYAVLNVLYPKTDKSVFNLIIKTLTEQITEDDILHFLTKVDLFTLLSEATTSISAGSVQSVDDGPRYHYPSHDVYQRVTTKRAANIGYSVIDYVINGADAAGDMAPEYPDGPVDSVSFLPSGVAGAKTPMNQQDLVGSAGWTKWFAHVTRAASLVGYELVRTKEERLRAAQEKKQTTTQSTFNDNTKFNKNTTNETVHQMLKAALNEYLDNNQETLDITYEISDSDRTVIEHLIEFTFDELNILEYPTIRLTNEREDIETTAYYNVQTYDIKVYTKNRALADILRSIVHEIIHHQQNIEGRLVRDADTVWAIDDTDPWETEAHAMAGHIITKFKKISEKNIYLNESMLLEGGAYGHMAHPFDDMGLTFGDLKTLITTALQGKLESVSEKLDGQNIMVSWKDGRLIFARNKSHIKNFGERALDVAGIKSMFSGRGALSDAFSLAADDLSSSIGKLSDKQKKKIFDNGRFFMNLEIIFVNNLNAIPYDCNVLIFHGALEYDEGGNVVGEATGSGRILAGMVKQINQHVQTTFNINGPVIASVPKSTDFSKHQAKYLNKLKSLQGKFKLKDSDTVALYHQKWWEDFVTKSTKKKKMKISNKEMMGLVKRWAFGDKSFRLNSKFIFDSELLIWANDFDKNNHDIIRRKNIAPFELIFLGVGADILTNYQSPFVIDNDSAVVSLKKELQSTAMELRKTTDVKKLIKFKRALEKLRAIGGMRAVVPTEGIVFTYKNGKVYKLTGTFAPVNTILGLLKY